MTTRTESQSKGAFNIVCIMYHVLSVNLPLCFPSGSMPQQTYEQKTIGAVHCKTVWGGGGAEFPSLRHVPLARGACASRRPGTRGTPTRPGDLSHEHAVLHRVTLRELQQPRIQY
jgi:hypothetical protein